MIHDPCMSLDHWHLIRVVILPGIFDHLSDAEAHSFATMFPVDLLLDRCEQAA